MLPSQDQIAGVDDEKGPIQSALRNALVLHQIFTNFPTTKLISTLSRVNKTWNFQARTFIRNYRNDCQANLSSISSRSTCVPCNRLREFSDTVTNMSVVPFTSISVVTHYKKNKDSDNECKNYSGSAAKNIDNVVRKLKLRKLRIQLHHCNRFSCAAIQYFVFRMICEHASKLQILQIRRYIPALLNSWLGTWTCELPELERIEWETSAGDLERNRNFLEVIFKGASKTLRHLRLGPACLFEALEMLTEDKYYRTLDRFDLEIGNEFVRRDQCLRVGRIGPALSELHIFDCHPDFNADFFTILGQLLRSSQQSLQSIRIRQLEMDFQDLFTSVDWPTLKNVKNFQLETRGTISEWISNLQESIDYSRIFPALETVSLDHIRGDDDEYEAEHEWDPDPGAVTYMSTSATKLELSLDLGEVNLSQLKSIFPFARFLQLETLSPNNLPALDQVFRLWPQLEQLILKGDNNAGENNYWRNYDADLCGIFPAEVETLRGKDEDFLRALQIVPIRPCITTLPKFNALRLLFWARKETPDPQSKWCEPSRQFLTHVTKVLAFEKLPGLEFVEITGPHLLGIRFDEGDIRCHPGQRWETKLVSTPLESK